MFISIVMPVYNNEKYFPIAVKSILEQSYDNFELIIIDDGSTDKTSIIADETQAHTTVGVLRSGDYRNQHNPRQNRGDIHREAYARWNSGGT